jgi:hypothetical protein
MGFVVDEVALGQVFLRVLWFPPVSIIPPLLNTHSSTTHAVVFAIDSVKTIGVQAEIKTRDFQQLTASKQSVSRPRLKPATSRKWITNEYTANGPTRSAIHNHADVIITVLRGHIMNTCKGGKNPLIL